MSTFKTILYQENGFINACQLYADIDTFIKNQMEELKVDKLGRIHPLQHILNSTSGNYIAPSSMKSFELCPAGYLVNKLFIEKTGTATSIGRTFHTIMEQFYEGKDRSKKQLDAITEKVIIEDQQIAGADEVRYYVNGYWDADDYYGGKMDHESLQCANEVFIKPVINPLGISIGIPIYLKIDRIDVRDQGINVIDYKTGKGDPDPYLCGEFGYLPQMIHYKWGTEAEYGEKTDKILLSVPGAYTRNLRWVEMEAHSLVQQSKAVDGMVRHIEHAKKARETKQFETTFMRYCGSCAIKEMCGAWIKKKGLDESKIAKEIPIEMEIKNSTYIEEEI